MNNYEASTIFLVIMLGFFVIMVIILIIELIRKGQEVDALHLCIEQEQRENECLRQKVDALHLHMEREQPECGCSEKPNDLTSKWIEEVKKTAGPNNKAE